MGFRNSKRENNQTRRQTTLTGGLRNRRCFSTNTTQMKMFVLCSNWPDITMWSATVTTANLLVCIPKAHPYPGSFSCQKPPECQQISNCLNNLITVPPLLNPPVPGPVDAVRAVLAVVWGHVELLFFRQRLCLHPRCLVYRPLPDGLPWRAFTDRRQDGAPIDVQVAGVRTKLDWNTRCFDLKHGITGTLPGFRRECRHAHQKVINTRLHREHWSRPGTETWRRVLSLGPRISKKKRRTDKTWYYGLLALLRHRSEQLE